MQGILATTNKQTRSLVTHADARPLRRREARGGRQSRHAASDASQGVVGRPREGTLEVAVAIVRARVTKLKDTFSLVASWPQESLVFLQINSICPTSTFHWSGEEGQQNITEHHAREWRHNDNSAGSKAAPACLK